MNGHKLRFRREKRGVPYPRYTEVDFSQESSFPCVMPCAEHADHSGTATYVYAYCECGWTFWCGGTTGCDEYRGVLEHLQHQLDLMADRLDTPSNLPDPPAPTHNPLTHPAPGDKIADKFVVEAVQVSKKGIDTVWYMDGPNFRSVSIEDWRAICARPNIPPDVIAPTPNPWGKE